MIKLNSYIIKNLVQIKSCGEFSCSKSIFEGKPYLWEFYYIKDGKIRICFDVNYHVYVAINNEISNHDKILNTIIKTFNETIKS